MASIINKWRYFVALLAIFCPITLFATTPCQSNQQTWLYTVDTSNQSHIVACLTHSNGAVPWFGFIQPNISATTVNFDASLGTEYTLTIATNVTSSTLSNAIAGQWMIFTIVEDGTGGHAFQQPANFVNWAPIDTTAGATTTEAGYFDGTYFQVISGGTGGGGGSCLAGASDTQYVDSAAGNDSNAGTNWCSSKLTEAAAVTALGVGGGWIYEAPNYTGAAASSVPSNVHILRTNQFDALGSTASRFSFPDWSDTTENHPSFFAGASATPADAAAAFTMLGPFGNSNLVSGMTGAVTVPTASSAYPSEQAGVAGIVTNNSTSGNVSQSDGVYGACYNLAASSLDCTGIVGVAGNPTTGPVGAFEAGWLNLSLGTTPSDAMGLVIRATGGHMPTAEIGTISGRPNAAIDVAYGGFPIPQAGDSFPSGLYFEPQSVANWPIVFSPNSITNNPYTNIYTFGLWKDYYFSTLYDSLSVVELNNGGVAGVYQRGNLLFNNSDTSSEVVLPLTHSGTISVDSINPVNSATPTYDRTKGKVQTTILTANVASSTLANCVAGQTVIFDIIENATGGWTFSPPANLHGWASGGTFTTTAGTHNRQEFYCDGTSTDSGGWSISSMQSGT